MKLVKTIYCPKVVDYGSNDNSVFRSLVPVSILHVNLPCYYFISYKCVPISIIKFEGYMTSVRLEYISISSRRKDGLIFTKCILLIFAKFCELLGSQTI